MSIETDADDIDADVVIAACGSYAPELLGPLGIDVPLMPTQEVIAYFRPKGGSLPDALPVINDLGAEQRYGLPTRSLGFYKFAEHGTGPRIDPRDRDPSPDPANVERLARAAVDYLPGFDPEPVDVETCVYENTPDRDFVIDRRGRVVVGTGFSGHGFKFAPLVGRLLADLALDRDAAVRPVALLARPPRAAVLGTGAPSMSERSHRALRTVTLPGDDKLSRSASRRPGPGPLRTVAVVGATEPLRRLRRRSSGAGRRTRSASRRR